MNRQRMIQEFKRKLPTFVVKSFKYFCECYYVINPNKQTSLFELALSWDEEINGNKMYLGALGNAIQYDDLDTDDVYAIALTALVESIN